MKTIIVLLALVLVTGCTSFQAARRNVNQVFEAEKQIVQDLKAWAAELEKERATKLGIMNAVADVAKVSPEYKMLVGMLTRLADKDNEEYKRAYDLALYLKALGFGARDIVLMLVGDAASFISIVTTMVGG